MGRRKYKIKGEQEKVDNFKEWFLAKAEIGELPTPINVIGKFGALIEKQKGLQKAKWINFFNIGKLISENSDEYGIDYFTKIYNIHPRTLKFCLIIYDKFKEQDKLLEFLDKYSNLPNSKIFRLITETPQYKNKSPLKLRTLVRQIYNKDNLNIEEMEELQKLYVFLRSRIPIKNQLDDIYYLPYSFCASCGALPPPEGLALISHPKFEQIKVPICEDCRAKASEIDNEKLLLIYFNYALNIEDGFNRILNERLGFNI